MKAFPSSDFHPSPAWTRESQLVELRHPNVIRVIDAKFIREPNPNDKTMPNCYTLMELAPYGTFLDFVSSKRFDGDEILARTYFHHLIDAIEYLHNNGIAHTNISLENLVLGQDYQLKLVGFSNLNSEKTGFRYSQGTKNFRAWEVKQGKSFSPKAADIYSAGIFLFVMKCGGMMPYVEDRPINGFDLFEILKKGYDAYWEAYHECQNRILHCDEDFMELFISMVKYNPSERASIESIKSNPWYQKEIYSSEELIALMKEKYRVSTILKKKSHVRQDFD
jgi:Serine/threonine protein kinase